MMSHAKMCRLSVLIGFAVVALASPALAGSMGSGTYRCTIQISPVSTHDCSDGTGIVTVTLNSGDKRVARIDLNQAFAWQSANFLVNLTNPTGWSMHLGDSPTNDGGGGDAITTRHDSEAQMNGTSYTTFFSDIGGTGQHSNLLNAIPSSGSFTVQWTVIQDSVSFDDDGNTADSPRISSTGSLASGTMLFDFPPYNEADSEDSSGADADKLYLGLNRTINNASRTGTGVTQACIFLSTSTTPNPATIAAECSV